MKVKYIICILTLIQYACQSSYKAPECLEAIILDTQTALNNKDVSSYFNTDIDFVKLETTETNLVRADAQKLVTDKYIYIGDQITKHIYMFNRQGKFIRRIGNVGRGPGEYVDLCGFYYWNDSLYIHDRVQTKLISYSVVDTGFNERRIFPPIYSSSITGSSNYLYFITNYSNKFNLVILNLQNGTLKYRLPYNADIEKNKSWWDLNQYYANYKDSVFFILSRNDTIYKISRDSVFPRYVTDFPVNKLPKQLLKKSGSEILQRSLDEGYICGLDRIYQTSRYIIGDFGEGNKSFQFLYDKTNGNTILAETFILENFGGLSLLNPLVTNNDEIICFYDALLFKEYGQYLVENKSFQKESNREKMLNFLSSLREDENPVMITMKFK